MTGFKITNGKGFHITFANGITVSVQFGPGNYSAHYNTSFESLRRDWESPDAEIAIWDKDNKWITEKFRNEGDDVLGYLSPKEVLATLNWAERQ